MKKILIFLMAYISVSPSISAQPMSVYECTMIIEKPWGQYPPGNFGLSRGPAVSENAAIQNMVNQYLSEGFPREIFEVVCTYQPPSQCVPSYWEPCGVSNFF
jgi:hypothetical protein